MASVHPLHDDQLKLDGNGHVTIRPGVRFLWPESIGGVSIPEPSQAKNSPNNLASLTAFHLIYAVHRAGHNRGIFSVSLGQTRPRQAEGVLHQLFGTERVGEDRCTDCRKGSGALTGCYQIPESSPGCANCTYCSRDKDCRRGDPSATLSRSW
ncbi:hypothetical protein ISF_00909 [Cordyceps fumosorosea ARSEF 2679]|uniref:Uncharacterized protein n=1 Tax=Cordyceps fumosorosea (strain ARSEF 2679) TaxID=1081104 RepID=A0A168EN16_CORFA|nr:hypothetical protein ISF_00909 [Cordyceps fumosorosea ARSEF 2679]OAA74008.1 hypothetical protein ISF_00909 [Cordyceps fumosorosea ARSEF 2679]